MKKNKESDFLGKPYEDENFPVASFIVKRNIQKYITRTFYFFAKEWLMILRIIKNLSSKLKVKILLYFDNAINKNKN